MYGRRTLNVLAVEDDPRQPMKRFEKSPENIQHIVEGLKDNVKGVEKSMRFVKIRRILYKVSQRKQVNCSLVRSEAAGNGPGISILYKTRTR